MFANKTLMITGGTGSFGNTVVKRFLSTDIAEIRIFSRDEKKQEEMRFALKNNNLKFYIGDVRDYDSIYQAMRGVDYVFHAAALKQVPSCEFHPFEAVRTNVLGAENVMSSALQNKVKRVIMLSTDKAVYPVNAMGLSKALMEKFMIAKTRLLNIDDTVFCATRYGNVLASRGSVVPLFVSQLKSGKPITITEPNMTRFLMSLDESVDLVMHAYNHGRQGDIFVQKAPACTIRTLAQALMELFEKKVELHIIGTRHGEKLYETLVSREELSRAEDMGKFYRVPADNRDLNYEKYFRSGEQKIAQFEDYTSHITERLDVEQVKDLLFKLNFIQGELFHAKGNDNFRDTARTYQDESCYC